MRVFVMRRFEMVLRVVAFWDECVLEVPITAAVDDLLMRLYQLTDEFDQIIACYSNAQECAEAARTRRDRAERELRWLLGCLYRLGRHVASRERIPDLNFGKRVASRGQTPVENAVRDVLPRAEAHYDLLRRYGMLETMLTDMRGWLKLLGEAEARRRSCLDDAFRLNPVAERLATEAGEALRHLDVLQRVLFAQRPDLLARAQAARSPSTFVANAICHPERVGHPEGACHPERSEGSL